MRNLSYWQVAALSAASCNVVDGANMSVGVVGPARAPCVESLYNMKVMGKGASAASVPISTMTSIPEMRQPSCASATAVPLLIIV